MYIERIRAPKSLMTNDLMTFFDLMTAIVGAVSHCTV